MRHQLWRGFDALISQFGRAAQHYKNRATLRLKTLFEGLVVKGSLPELQQEVGDDGESPIEHKVAQKKQAHLIEELIVEDHSNPNTADLADRRQKRYPPFLDNHITALADIDPAVKQRLLPGLEVKVEGAEAIGLSVGLGGCHLWRPF